MKVAWTDDNKPRVELYKRQTTQLQQTLVIAGMLVELRKPEGEALAEAVNAVLEKFSAEPGEADAKDGDE